MTNTLDRGPWIQTYSGRALHLLTPSPDEITLADIAHALSLKTRFTGHSQYHYSVAQHCVLGSGLLYRSHGAEMALAFLLHELGEVYLPDVASPLKASLTWRELGGQVALPWVQLEYVHNVACLKALGLYSEDLLDDIHDTVVKAMDRAMLMREAAALMQHLLPGWGYEAVPPADCSISRWSPEYAEQAWLESYRHLRDLYDLLLSERCSERR
jgi:hypothetical protein